MSSITTLRRCRRRLAEDVGLVWSQDVLRHTYASMRLAAGATPGEVAAEMGTSERMLGNHYREIVTREEAEAFWSVRPE